MEKTKAGMRWTALIVSLFVVFPALSLFGAGTVDANEATIYRDEFGIPHVFAPTLEDAAYAVGYAQAEDRLEELLKNYRRANGTMAEVFGPDYFRQDVIQRIWRHGAISREKYEQVSAGMRAVIEAYQQGIKQFMKEHPEQVPAWAQEIHPWDVIALGRFIIWGWPMGEAGGDLERGGIKLDDLAYRGSNEILIGPSRTAMKAPSSLLTSSTPLSVTFLVLPSGPPMTETAAWCFSNQAFQAAMPSCSLTRLSASGSAIHVFMRALVLLPRKTARNVSLVLMRFLLSCG